MKNRGHFFMIYFQKISQRPAHWSLYKKLWSHSRTLPPKDITVSSPIGHFTKKRGHFLLINFENCFKKTAPGITLGADYY